MRYIQIEFLDTNPNPFVLSMAAHILGAAFWQSVADESNPQAGYLIDLSDFPLPTRESILSH